MMASNSCVMKLMKPDKEVQHTYQYKRDVGDIPNENEVTPLRALSTATRVCEL